MPFPYNPTPREWAGFVLRALWPWVVLWPLAWYAGGWLAKVVKW